MRARLLRTWTTGIGVALVGMVCGLAVMAVAVSADDGDAAEGGCPAATATATPTATEEVTDDANAALVRSLHLTADEDGAACPGEGDRDQDDEAPGNSGAARSCPFGGEEGESGESYRNHGECVSEAAHRRKEERRAARHGTPTPTGTATGTPTATATASPTGTPSAATAGGTRPGRGQHEREDEGDGHRRGGGAGPGVGAQGGPSGQGGPAGSQGNGRGTGGRGRR